MDEAGRPEHASSFRAEEKLPGPKCPRCRSRGIAASRRKTSWEEWSALWGRNYFRCGACDCRFSVYGKRGDSESYHARIFILRRVASRIALICGVIALVVVLVVGVDFLINGLFPGPGIRK